MSNIRAKYRYPFNTVILARDENFIARFGGILKDLNFKRQDRLVLVYFVAALLRKFWLACMIVYQVQSPVFCIIQVNFQALVMLTISGYTQPMVSRTSNTMDLVNEGFILLITYHLYQFTEFMTDLSIRKHVGISMIVVTIFSVSLNIGVVVVQTTTLTLHKLKLKYL